MIEGIASRKGVLVDRKRGVAGYSLPEESAYAVKEVAVSRNGGVCEVNKIAAFRKGVLIR